MGFASSIRGDRCTTQTCRAGRNAPVNRSCELARTPDIHNKSRFCMHAHRGDGATGNGPRKEVRSGSGTANVLGRGKSRRVLYRGRDAAGEATRPDPAATGGLHCCSPLATQRSPKCCSHTHSGPALVQHRKRCPRVVSWDQMEASGRCSAGRWRVGVPTLQLCPQPPICVSTLGLVVHCTWCRSRRARRAGRHARLQHMHCLTCGCVPADGPTASSAVLSKHVFAHGTSQTSRPARRCRSCWQCGICSNVQL